MAFGMLHIPFETWLVYADYLRKLELLMLAS